MAIQDVDDLISQLRQHPEWRDALRREILTEELLSLPQIVRELVAQVRKLAAQVGELAEAQQRTEQRLEELARAQLRSEEQLKALNTQMGELRGDNLERRYREHAGAFFGPLLRKIRTLRDEELTALADDALDAGKLSEEERADLLLSDLVVYGRDPKTHQEIYLLVEVSVGVGEKDVERAARRAALLSRLSPTRATVAGEWINAEAVTRCRELGVWQVLNGSAISPIVS